MIRKRYGVTTLYCFYCKNAATTKTKDGLAVCRRCKDIKNENKCPVCGMDLDIRTGKYGDYFYCWTCNKNWSKRNIQKFVRL